MRETLISAGIGLIGAIIGGAATYIGGNNQIKEQRQLLNEENLKSKELSIRILMRFIWEEVENNIDILIRWQESTVGGFRLNFNEYDSVKYELIKHKSESIEELFKLYYLFRQFERTHIGKSKENIGKEIERIIEARDKITSAVHLDII